MSQVSSFSSFNSTPPPPPGGTGGMGVLKNPKVILLGVIGLGLIVFIFLKNRSSGSADSGYPLGQPNTPSGASGGSPISDPPANTSNGPLIQSFGNGIVACDSINGCQYFDHPQGATTVAPTTTAKQPKPSSTPIPTAHALKPQPAPPPTPPVIQAAPQPIGPAPIVQPAPAVSPVPSTVTHPVPVPAFSPGGITLPVGSQNLANQVNSAAQSALNSVFAHPAPAPPPPAATHVPLRVAPAPAPAPKPAPKPAPRPAPPPLRTPINAPRPV